MRPGRADKTHAVQKRDSVENRILDKPPNSHDFARKIKKRKGVQSFEPLSYSLIFHELAASRCDVGLSLVSAHRPCGRSRFLH